jgi:hypothetical protein
MKKLGLARVESFGIVAHICSVNWGIARHSESPRRIARILERFKMERLRRAGSRISGKVKPQRGRRSQRRQHNGRQRQRTQNRKGRGKAARPGDDGVDASLEGRRPCALSVLKRQNRSCSPQCPR